LWWIGCLLVKLGLKVYGAGAAQVKAHQKRVEGNEAMLQNPKQMLVRASQAETTNEWLRPATSSDGSTENLLLAAKHGENNGRNEAE
jgi:hypothetical protein